jgi:hypothetical protein
MNVQNAKECLAALTNSGTGISSGGQFFGFNEFKNLQEYVSSLESVVTQMLIEKYSQSK